MASLQGYNAPELTTAKKGFVVPSHGLFYDLAYPKLTNRPLPVIASETTKEMIGH
jgi:hypothetical protein